MQNYSECKMTLNAKLLKSKNDSEYKIINLSECKQAKIAKQLRMENYSEWKMTQIGE